MQNLFTGFKQELGSVRKLIENQNDFNFAEIDDYLYSKEFYKQAIRYRIDEYFEDRDITKEELLKMLSLWEISL